MAVLDTLRQDALDALHATVNSLHSDFAAKLVAAGHDVSADDHTDKLVAAATTAVAQPGQPPTYADAALASFSLSMTHALLAFATQHLPAKFQPILAAAEPGVEQLALDLGENKPVEKSELIDDAVKVAETAASVLIPGAAPVVALVEAVRGAFEHGSATPASVEQTAVGAVESVIEHTAEAAAEKALPGLGGALADAALHAVEGTIDDALKHPGG